MLEEFKNILFEKPGEIDPRQSALKFLSGRKRNREHVAFLHLQREWFQRLLIERLVLEQKFCRLIKNVVILFQDCAGTVKGILDYRAYRLVDLARCILAVSSCWLRDAGQCAEEGRRLVLI